MTSQFYQIPVNVSEIREVLSEALPGWVVNVYNDYSSTQILAKDLFKSGYRGRALFIVRNQTSGRGRKTRSWISSPDGIDLTMTILIPIEKQVKNITLLSIVGGIAVVEALNHISQNEFKVKWPNDIYFKDSKVGGILSEFLLDDEIDAVAMGIGLNVNSCQEDFPQDDFFYEVNTVSAIMGTNVDLVRIILLIINQLESNLHLIEDKFFNDFISRWKDLGWRIGEKIVFRETGAQWQEGIADSLDKHGFLVIRDTNGDVLATIAEGDVKKFEK